MTEYYENKLKQGTFYQDMVIEKLYNLGLPLISYSSKQFQTFIGENKAGIEIKNDMNFKKTNNFYIEIAEKSNANNINYVPSGIYRNDNTWLYIIGDNDVFYVFSKKQLKILAEQKVVKNNKEDYKYKRVQTPTSIGVLLNVDIAKEFFCILEVKFEVNEFDKIKNNIGVKND